MTVSTHVYTATLLGAPNRALLVRGGSVTLDDRRAPHVEASLKLAMPPAATLTALDPRMSPPPRVRISVAATLESSTQARTFDLTLRDMDVNHAFGTVALSLSSDESLLIDYAPAVEDRAPLDRQASVRSVCNYVLGRVIPGAALIAGPDADVTRYWSVTNLLPNPRPTHNAIPEWVVGFNGNLVGSTTMSSPIPPNGPYAVQWTAGGAGISTLAAGSPSSYRVSPGRWYTFSFYVASGATTNARAALQWRSRNGEGTLETVYGAVVSSVSAEFRRVHVIARAPVGAESVWPFIDTTGNTAGRAHFVASAMLHEGDILVPYFDGGTVQDGYNIAWTDPAKPHATASVRKPPTEAPPEALIWGAGVPAFDFLLPLVQSVGLRLVCDENRVWTLRDENYAAADTIAIRHGINLVDGTDKISRTDDSWFDAALTRYSWNDRDGNPQTADDVYASPNYSRLRVFEKSTPYPGPGFSAYMVRRSQGRGREVSATAVADWRARAEQPVQVVLDGAPIQTGRTSRVEFDLDRDEMTVTTRSTDTPANAIDLLTGTINAQTRTINNL